LAKSMPLSIPAHKNFVTVFDLQIHIKFPEIEDKIILFLKYIPAQSQITCSKSALGNSCTIKTS